MLELLSFGTNPDVADRTGAALWHARERGQDAIVDMLRAVGAR